MTEPSSAPLPLTPADVRLAAERLAGVVVRTPLLESPLLNQRLGCRVLVKAECLQRTGSFKLRGAWNRLAVIPERDRPRGVLAYSSGNHGQAVAAAAREFGIPATIVMPTDAPAIKRRNTEAFGAQIIAYDRYHQDREAIGTRLAAETGATLVKPYDDPWVIAGQGTVGLEIVEQCTELGVRPDAILVPCGGGGLTAGIATLCRTRLPELSLYAVEPAGFDDTGRSLAAGQRVRNVGTGGSVCDALLAPEPGALTFALNQALGVQGLSVTDAETVHAMQTAFEALKLVVEPSGAVALAAILADPSAWRGRTAVAVASGGNVDAAGFTARLGSAASQGATGR